MAYCKYMFPERGQFDVRPAGKIPGKGPGIHFILDWLGPCGHCDRAGDHTIRHNWQSARTSNSWSRWHSDLAARDWIQVYSGKGIKGGRNGRHFFEGPGVAGPGGGQIGAVLVSRFIKRGTISTTAYNHYSVLRSIQDFFGLEYLGQKGLKSFGKDIFTQPNG